MSFHAISQNTVVRAHETVLHCPVCRHREWVPSIAIRRALLSSCRVCGLIATTAFLTGAQRVACLYEVSADDHRIYQAHYLPHRLVSFRKVLPLLETYRATSRMLEIGSGYGDFLCLASEAGWDVEGVEISRYGCRVAQLRGCKVHNSHLSELKVPEGSFDVVVMWDVIEHFADPDVIMTTCSRLLRTGGALVMKTPDARALRPTNNIVRKLYQQGVYPANTAEHVFHYTAETLQRALTSSGFGGFLLDDRVDWDERVISGKSALVRAARSIIMRYAHKRHWPYEFLIAAVKQ
jgi:2-polyprenyl-3-methyl-5-hydroxy-6-metoxy-1,4-benzoquinol methylase